MPINQNGGLGDLVPLLGLMMQQKSDKRRDALLAEQIANERERLGIELEKAKGTTALQVAQAKQFQEILDANANVRKARIRDAELAAAEAATVQRNEPGLAPVQESATRTLGASMDMPTQLQYPLKFNLPLPLPAETGVTNIHEVDLDTPMRDAAINADIATGILPSTAALNPEQMRQAGLIATGQAMTSAQGFSLFDSVLKNHPNAQLRLPGVVEAMRKNDWAGAFAAIDNMGDSVQAAKAKSDLSVALINERARYNEGLMRLRGTIYEVQQRDRASLREHGIAETNSLIDKIDAYGSLMGNLGKFVSDVQDIPESQDTIKASLERAYTLQNDIERDLASLQGRHPSFAHIRREHFFGADTISPFDKGTHPYASGTYTSPQDEAEAMRQAWLAGETEVEFDDVEDVTGGMLGLRSRMDPSLTQPMQFTMPDASTTGASFPRAPSAGLGLGTSDPADYETLGSKKLKIPEKWQSEAREWIATMEEVELRAQLPKGLLAAMAQVESNWDPNATSPKGARGLIQFMPDTAAEMAATVWPDGSVSAEDVMSNPHYNSIAAGAYARWLLDQPGIDGDINKMLTAYNAGIGKVQRILKETGGNLQLDSHPDWKDEQRLYASKVTSYMEGLAPRLTAGPSAAATRAAATGTTPTTRYSPKDFTIGDIPAAQPPAPAQYTPSSQEFLARAGGMAMTGLPLDAREFPHMADRFRSAVGRGVTPPALRDVRTRPAPPADTPQTRIAEWEHIAQTQVIPALIKQNVDPNELMRVWQGMSPSQRIEWTQFWLERLGAEAIPAAPAQPYTLDPGTTGSPGTPLRVTVTP